MTLLLVQLVRLWTTFIDVNACSPKRTTPALLVYDYFLTLPQEVQCIWGRKLSIPVALFYLNRYTSLIYRVFLIAGLIDWQGDSPGIRVEDM